jgi:small subunit ribosomal protein S2
VETQIAENLLLPQEILLSAGVHIGTRVKTNDMAPFIYKVRPDGLFVLDMEKMNERIMVAAKFLARVDQNRIAVASSKRYGRRPVERFCELTGAKPFTGRFTSGSFTNPIYSNFFEPQIVIVTDALADSQIVNEASTMGIPVIAFCSTDKSLKDVEVSGYSLLAPLSSTQEGAQRTFPRSRLEHIYRRFRDLYVGERPWVSEDLWLQEPSTHLGMPG